MNALKLTIIGSILLISSLTELSAQVSKSSSPEGRLGASKPFVKKELSPELAITKNKETVIQLEKQEKELMDMSTSVDGRSSKEETAIINQSKMIRETISK